MSHNQTYIIPINKDFLIYSPLVQISALVNGKAAFELKEQIQKIRNNKGSRSSKLFKLANEIVNGPLQKPIRKTGNLNPEFLGIIPTRTCNGACNYCDFGADKASTQKMPYHLASRAVDWYADILKQNGRNILDIHFFGGEPMMARDVIEVAVHRARLVAREQEMIPIFEISTNGQYKKDDAKFLGNYFNRVVLSFDGFKDFHDKHRPLKANKSSFKNATETAKIISDSSAELNIRCCISHLNVIKMEEITEWLCKNYRLSAINFEILCESSLTLSKELYSPNPIDFAIHFQNSKEIAESYCVPLIYASDIGSSPVVSSCPVGKDTAIVSPDGRISNCYLMPEKWQNIGLNLDFGIIQSDGEVHIDDEQNNVIRNMVENKPRCVNCFCQWSCAGGCHVGITFPGSTNEYDNFCTQTRLISAFSLLSNLGLTERIKELINSPESIQKLVKQKSDSLAAFEN